MSHCLRPRQIVNPHYNPKTDKGRRNLQLWRGNNASVLYPDDYFIFIPCGCCLGCLRDKARSWRVRLLHEHMFGGHRNCLCLTLTISPDYYDTFSSPKKVADRFRAFIDRLRYYTRDRKCPKRFFVSELGEERGRLHFHGFLWDTDLTVEQLRKAWRYGFICVRPFRSAKQLSYATKYITKPAVAWHQPMVFVSPGLGKDYTLRPDYLAWHRRGCVDSPINYCVRFDSYVYALPRYYRDKIFTADQIADFKRSLSETDESFEKPFGRITFTDPIAYARARESMLETSIRSGKTLVKHKSVHSLYSYAGYSDVDNEFSF